MCSMFLPRTGLEMTHIIAKMYSLVRQGKDMKKDIKILSVFQQIHKVITNMYINIPFYASPFSSVPFRSIPFHAAT